MVGRRGSARLRLVSATAVLLLVACVWMGCGIPYSIGSKYPNLIGRTARLKREMVICSSEGHNFSISGLLLLTPDQAAGFGIKPVVRVEAGETLTVVDLVCAIDHTGKSCHVLCDYMTERRVYRFYVGPFEERPSFGKENMLWELVSTESE